MGVKVIFGGYLNCKPGESGTVFRYDDSVFLQTLKRLANVRDGYEIESLTFGFYEFAVAVKKNPAGRLERSKFPVDCPGCDFQFTAQEVIDWGECPKCGKGVTFKDVALRDTAIVKDLLARERGKRNG
jgi:hypothetical protein